MPKNLEKFKEDIINLKKEFSENEFRNRFAEIKSTLESASEGDLIYSEEPDPLSVCVMQRNNFVLEIRLSNANQGLKNEFCLRIYFTEPVIIEDCLLYLNIGCKPYKDGKEIQDSQIDDSAEYARKFEIEYYRYKS